MPKIFGRDVPPVLLGGATLLACYLVFDAMQTPPNTVTRNAKKAPQQKKAVDAEYGPKDYTATFASLSNVSPKDAFRPLVMKTTGSSANPNIDNFTYSGMALLNNEPNGLLENATTGQGDFVKPGQHWHQQWLVLSVTPDQIDLRNDFGDVTTLKAGSSAKDAGPAAAGANGTGATAPFNPALIGQIGGDMSVQADANNPMPQINNGNGRNGGGRRNRNRGGNGQMGGMNYNGN